MIDFFLKSTISLCILLIAYHLFLEKEKMFRFNRFFLLISLVFSIVVPFISFGIQKEIPIVHENAIPFKGITANAFPILTIEKENTIIEEQIDYWIPLSWAVYVIITIILSFRFIRNIYIITSKAKVSNVVEYKNTRVVLLSENILPYTFWNTIYVSQKDFENREIEQELFTHEIAHVKQKHTIDVIFVEILKTVFWFNPLFIFYKKAIQLNHEFLADENVIAAHRDLSFYQNLLLNKISVSQPVLLTSNLNFLATKKRLVMMTKITTKSKAIITKLVLLSLFVGLVLMLCIQFYPSDVNASRSEILKDKRRDYIYSGIRIIVDNQKENRKINELYDNLDTKTKRKYIGAYSTPLITRKTPTESEFENWKNSNEYVIILNDKKIMYNDNLEQLKRKEIVYFSDEKLDFKFEKNGKKDNTYYLYTYDYFKRKKLGRFPQKYGKKEFKTTWLKPPTKEQMKIMLDREQKRMEAAEIKRLNTSFGYSAKAFNREHKNL